MSYLPLAALIVGILLGLIGILFGWAVESFVSFITGLSAGIFCWAIDKSEEKQTEVTKK